MTIHSDESQSDKHDLDRELDSYNEKEKQNELNPTAPISLSHPVEDSDSDGSDENVGITQNDIAEIVTVVDEDLPVLTIRMWILAFGFGSVIAGVDAFFLMRYPSVSVSAIVGQFLCFPLGQLWYRVVPQWKIWNISLNPGPFNKKEHACITMFINVVVSAKLVNTMFAEQVKYFNVDIGIGRSILFNMSCYLIAWGWAGLAYPILVKPASIIWPATLSTCALLKTLHSNDNHVANGWRISRLAFFGLVFTGSFVWYWFPDLIMPFVSYIGAFISWAAPTNATVGQVFGVKNGLGLLPLTLDWAQISSIGNPLSTPFWATACIFGSFVFWCWIIMPALYYQNKWQTAHLPIMTNGIYNKNGTKFLPKQVINKDWTLNLKKLENYSPVVLPVSFILNICLSLGSFAALWVAFSLRFKADVIDRFKTDQYNDIHNRILSKYKYLHWGFYLASVVVGLALGFAFCEGWGENTQITSYGFVVAFLIGGSLFVPLSLVESRANLTVGMNAFFNIVSAFWFEGQPMALVYFYGFGFSTLQHAMHVSQSAKIGHYLKVPPMYAMIVLFMSACWAAIVNPAVTGWVLYHIEDVCTADAKNNMICRSIQTSFNNHLIWGLMGKSLFKAGGRYSFVHYFFLVGAIIPLAVYAMTRLRPKSVFWRKINPVLLLGGAAQIPSVTGYNYSTYFLAAFGFNYLIHKFKNAWWRKYNLVLAVGLDCGVAIAAVLIYFCVVYTGGSDNFSWWGTTVADSSCDSKGCPHLPAKAIKLPPGTIF